MAGAKFFRGYWGSSGAIGPGPAPGDWRNRPIDKLVVLGDSITNTGMRTGLISQVSVVGDVLNVIGSTENAINWTAGSYIALANCSPVEFNTKIHSTTGGATFTGPALGLTGIATNTTPRWPIRGYEAAFINPNMIGYAMQQSKYPLIEYVMQPGAAIEELHMRLDEVLKHKPSHVHVWAGVNNMSETSADAVAKIIALCDALRAAGIFIFLGTLLPRPQGAPNENLTIWRYEFNAALKNYAAANAGQVKVLDYFTHMLASGDTKYAPDSYFIDAQGVLDNSHPNDDGHNHASALMVAELDRLAVDYAESGVNIFRNPGHTTTVNIAEGVRPTGVSIINGTGGTMASSVANGEWTLAFTGVTAGYRQSVVYTGEDTGTVQAANVLRYNSVDVRANKDITVELLANHTHNAVSTTRQFQKSKIFGNAPFRRIQSNVELLEAGQQQYIRQLILYVTFPEAGDYTIVLKNPVVGNIT